MPLSFRSQNHGDIAFGFFNIESDMLLLENYFFFADAFCKFIVEIEQEISRENHVTDDAFEFMVYEIQNREDAGDLMEAIHGIRYSGFIGETYRLFPFPGRPEDFKQNPDGFKTQNLIKKMISRFACLQKICVQFSREKVSIGRYRFSVDVFNELLLYVDRGGYPRWRDEKRPDYVSRMMEKVRQSSSHFFKG